MSASEWGPAQLKSTLERRKRAPLLSADESSDVAPGSPGKERRRRAKGRRTSSSSVAASHTQRSATVPSNTLKQIERGVRLAVLGLGLLGLALLAVDLVRLSLLDEQHMQVAALIIVVTCLSPFLVSWTSGTLDFLPEMVREGMVPVGALVVMCAALVFRAQGRVEWEEQLLGWAVLLTGIPLLGDTVSELLEGKFDVDLIALLSLSVGYFLGDRYTSLVIVIMLTGGETLEAYAVARAGRNLRALLETKERVVKRLATGDLHADSESVDIALVNVGDHLLVQPGEMVLVEATMESATGLMDVSRMTGEGLPQVVAQGECVLSGSVNLTHPVVLRTDNQWPHSTYARLQSDLKKSLKKKSSIEKIASRYAALFTPLTVFLAGVAFQAAGQDWQRALAVFSCATPCPLIIGVPVAMVAGIALAARHGIIVKSGTAMEAVGVCDTVVFDKTGTLTVAAAELTHTYSVNYGFSESKVLQVAASVECFSDHILAKAITSAFVRESDHVYATRNVEEHEGYGVSAEIHMGVEQALDKSGDASLSDTAEAASEMAADKGADKGRTRSGSFHTYHPVHIGSRNYMESLGVDVSEVDVFAESSEVGAQALVTYVALDHQLLGFMLFEDVVREQSAAVVSQLRQHGVRRIVLLSGDTSSTVERVAGQVGIDEWYAECLPDDKVQLVRSLQQDDGCRVLMVGDGTNDALALREATLGVAIATRDSLASASADVVIATDQITKVAQLVHLGQRVRAIASVTAFGGIGLSLILMAIASFGYIVPFHGALLQEAVDVLSILNSMRVLGVALTVVAA